MYLREEFFSPYHCMTKEEVVEQLRVGVYQITFYKKDGKLREMVGSLAPKEIAQVDKAYFDSKQYEQRKNNSKLVPVYETTSLSWRSFNLDRLVGFTKLYSINEEGERIDDCKPYTEAQNNGSKHSDVVMEDLKVVEDKSSPKKLLGEVLIDGALDFVAKDCVDKAVLMFSLKRVVSRFEIYREVAKLLDMDDFLEKTLPEDDNEAISTVISDNPEQVALIMLDRGAKNMSVIELAREVLKRKLEQKIDAKIDKIKLDFSEYGKI